jgi:hypothetical protein
MFSVSNVLICCSVPNLLAVEGMIYREKNSMVMDIFKLLRVPERFSSVVQKVLGVVVDNVMDKCACFDFYFCTL